MDKNSKSTIDDTRRAGNSPTGHRRFPELTRQELQRILGQTIKQDDTNKIVVFLSDLLAYTDNCQLNDSFNAPSSTGKSYIPLEIASLFPQEDVIEVGYCSPTAFFHDHGKFNKKLGGYVVDLSRKVIVFLDQPHTLLVEHLRPLLSHDKKEIHLKITDTSKKHGLRTKNVLLKGFASVTFCTGRLAMDEQEQTRFFLLSPEVTQEKLRQAIHEKIRKDADYRTYVTELDSQAERVLLKARIAAIKRERITDVRVPNAERIEKAFFDRNKVLKPRHTRDVGRLMGVVKAFALLNLWYREREGSVVVANDADIDAGLVLWDEIAESQEYNIPPYVYKLYQEIILPAYAEKGAGLSRQDITRKHVDCYKSGLPHWKLRQEILPMLESAGLIYQEADEEDRRKMLVFPEHDSNVAA